MRAFVDGCTPKHGALARRVNVPVSSPTPTIVIWPNVSILYLSGTRFSVTTNNQKLPSKTSYPRVGGLVGILSFLQNFPRVIRCALLL